MLPRPKSWLVLPWTLKPIFLTNWHVLVLVLAVIAAGSLVSGVFGFRRHTFDIQSVAPRETTKVHKDSFMATKFRNEETMRYFHSVDPTTRIRVTDVESFNYARKNFPDSSLWMFFDGRLILVYKP